MDNKSYYQRKMAEAQQKDLSKQTWLTEFEGAAHARLGRTAFRRWAEKNGCRRKVGKKNLYLRAEIDEALERGGRK